MNRTRRAFLSTLVAIVGAASIGIAPSTAQTIEQYETFVLRSYSDLLARSPESPAFEIWVNDLAGGLARTSYVNALLQSREFQEVVVNNFFLSYLERFPDPFTRAAFAPFVDGASAWQQLQGQILGSPEFFGLAGGDNESFVTALYAVLLDRGPDSPGFNSALGKLGEGWTRQMVAEAFAVSPEARSVFVQGLYGQLLSRGADGGSLDVWVTAPYATVLLAIVASDEYFNLPI